MLSRSERKRIRALGNRKDREAEGLFLAEGIRVVEELLDAGVEVRTSVISPALSETDRGRQLAARLAEAGPVLDAARNELNELADTSTNQGVLVVAEIPMAALDDVPLGDRSTLLVLDGVQDPGNLGTLIRSATAFGCDLAAYLPGTVDPWNPKAVRASAGTVFRLPTVAARPEPLTEWLGERGYLLLGADAAGRPVDRLTLPGRTAVAVGNEGGGLSGFLRSRVDSLVAVPMAGAVESLNVAVAAGILLYLVTRNPA